jgi:hypothetical protein
VCWLDSNCKFASAQTMSRRDNAFRLGTESNQIESSSVSSGLQLHNMQQQANEMSPFSSASREPTLRELVELHHTQQRANEENRCIKLDSMHTAANMKPVTTIAQTKEFNEKYDKEFARREKNWIDQNPNSNPRKNRKWLEHHDKCVSRRRKHRAETLAGQLFGNAVLVHALRNQNYFANHDARALTRIVSEIRVLDLAKFKLQHRDWINWPTYLIDIRDNASTKVGKKVHTNALKQFKSVFRLELSDFEDEMKSLHAREKRLGIMVANEHNSGNRVANAHNSGLADTVNKFENDCYDMYMKIKQRGAGKKVWKAYNIYMHATNTLQT